MLVELWLYMLVIDLVEDKIEVVDKLVVVADKFEIAVVDKFVNVIGKFVVVVVVDKFVIVILIDPDLGHDFTKTTKEGFIVLKIMFLSTLSFKKIQNSD